MNKCPIQRVQLEKKQLPGLSNIIKQETIKDRPDKVQAHH